MRFVDFFAGIGGFRRGMELAGHECVGFCEWDKFAYMSYVSMHLLTEDQRAYLATLDLKERQKEILKGEYRNGEWHSNDVRTVEARSLPEADIWCFGAPCQDFSNAGNKQGLNGNRSSLIMEIFRLLRETDDQIKPEWIIYENVKGMLWSNKGADFLAILSEVDELGYDAEWQTLNSKHFGVPQSRERAYFIGHFRKKGFKQILPIEYIVEPDSVRGDLIRTVKVKEATKKGYSEARLNIDSFNYGRPDSNHRGRVGKDIAHTLKTQIDQGIFLSDRPVIARSFTPKECFRLQGWTDDYYEKAAFVNSDSQLYKQAGNGVTVNVIYEIGKALNNAESDS